MNDAQLVGRLEGAFRARVRPSQLTQFLDIARRKPLGVLAALWIAVMLGTAALAPVVAPYDPIRVMRGPGMAMKPPLSPGEVRGGVQGPTLVLGSDVYGRDIFSRIIWGTRVSLTVSLIAVILGTGTGVAVGLVSGYVGGGLDLAMQRIVDGIQAFPGILLALSIVAVLGPSTVNVFLALAVIIAPGQSRVARGAVLTIKENMYVEAARALGAGSLRIMLRHIFPNIMAPTIILGSIVLGNAILIESTLSFLGLGTPPPEASWGNMLGNVATRSRIEINPVMAVWPGLAISLAVYAFNLLGDTLRDVLDPRLRGR